MGSDEVISIKDLAILINKLTGSDSEISYLPPLKDGHMYRRKPDITKMRRQLGKLISIEEGIKELIKYVVIGYFLKIVV